jgi:signal transduction histidine kinase/ActR/RegA family two-component response regulator
MPNRPLHDHPADPPPEREPQPRIPMPAGLLPTLYEILDAAILVLHGKFGTIQLYDPTRRVLELACQRGFFGPFLDALASVSIDTGMAAPRSIRNHARVVVTDVNADPDYAPYRELAANAGYRAIQSTPIVSRDGEVLGALVTHLPDARAFSAHELQVLDLYSRQAADAIVRARVERDLATARSRLESALRVGEMGVYEWNMITDQVYGDPNFRRMIDVEFDENGFAPRHLLYERIHPDDREERLKRVQRTLDTGEPYEAEYRILTSARPRWVISRGTVDYDQTGRPVHFTGVLVDITARKHAEEALLEADRQKNAFLAQLAHELRNPLAPIRNAARIVRMRQSAEDMHWASDMIDRQVRHLTRLIDDLLDVSRISRNKLEVRRQQTELKDIVNAAVEISGPVIDQNGHQLGVRVPEEPVLLLADSARLTQALMNLLNNAAKYTDAGGRIDLDAKLEGDHATIRVRDNGIGIEAAALPQVFNMFFQVDSSLERAQGGLGIGLSLVKSVVELHGGTVEARSEGLGHGSEFTMRVPAQRSARNASPSEAGTVDPGTAGAARRVLVVDDNRDAAESLALFLQLGGHIVSTAFDGEEALEEAQKFRPDVALLDLGMPKLNGYEVCRRLRATDWGRRIVLIAQTGWGQDEDKRRTREAGFDAHLVKPTDPVTVMKMVEARNEVPYQEPMRRR